MTIKNVDTDITFIANGVEKIISGGEIYDAGKFSVTLTSASDKDFSLNSGIINADASDLTKKVTLTGNSENNSIVGGTKNDKISGDAGNDSLWGGKGNDTLIGGAGADTFIYKIKEGNDKISDYNFAEGDELQILGGTFKKSSFSAKSGNLTLTINGGGKIIFEDVALNDQIKINGSTYTVGQKQLTK